MENPNLTETSGSKSAPNLLEIEAKWEHDSLLPCNSTSPETFTMILPPPNVTGTLHLGHALMASIQDAIVRWHRLSGREVLWIPGTDHAGIATQVVVEKKIQREQGKTRHEIGREKFLEEVWKWKNESGSTIITQLKRLGCSLDWDKEIFTMDEPRSLAVTEAFCRLYERGLIYRGNRMVNWCCKLQSVISDDEVEKETIEKPTQRIIQEKKYPFGYLWYIKYPLVSSSGDFVIVATTRPETIPGDVALAVNSKDQRYASLVGKTILHPISGRILPIIVDDLLVDPAFGTGVVKVTPAHDEDDYECALRHSLEIIPLFDDAGILHDTIGELNGLSRFDARLKVLEILKEKDLLEKREPYSVKLKVCSRTGDIIEPMLKPQWYVKTTGRMAESALNAVESGALELIPSTTNAVWDSWLHNIRDWCISRQLWWGHRIPAYRVQAREDEWIVARTPEEALIQARLKYGENVIIEQDPDVLDTWFSASLLPFASMGWPLAKFSPTSLLETGADILFFWVSKMVMMGLELTGELPFKRVLLHRIVRDASGRKMSKSLGNVIDPLDVIFGVSLNIMITKLMNSNLSGEAQSHLEGALLPRMGQSMHLGAEEIAKATVNLQGEYPSGIEPCGADALRFALCWYSSQETDIHLNVHKIVAMRKFCIKVANAVRYTRLLPSSIYHDEESFVEKWIQSRLHSTIRLVNDAFEKLHLSSATEAIHAFWFNDLCDVFIEFTKNSPELKKTLMSVIESALLLLHPFMPFLTKELLTSLDPNRTYVFPVVDMLKIDPTIEEEMTILLEIVHEFWSLRNTNSLNGSVHPVGYLIAKGGFTLSPHGKEIIMKLTKCSDLQIVPSPLPSIQFVPVKTYARIGLQLETPKVDLRLLESKLAKAQESRDRLLKRMNKPQYATNCPEEVRQKDIKALADLDKEIQQYTDALR